MYEALNAMVFNVSLREHQVVMLHALSPMSMKLCPFEGFPPNRQSGFCFGYFWGGDRPPPGFSSFHQGNRLKIGKMYETVNAMVINRLL